MDASGSFLRSAEYIHIKYAFRTDSHEYENLVDSWVQKCFLPKHFKKSYVLPPFCGHLFLQWLLVVSLTSMVDDAISRQRRWYIVYDLSFVTLFQFFNCNEFLSSVDTWHSNTYLKAVSSTNLTSQHKWVIWYPLLMSITWKCFQLFDFFHRLTLLKIAY